MSNKMKLHSCDCSEATPYLIFNNRSEPDYVKKRVKAAWKSLEDVKNAILKPPSEVEIIEEAPEAVTEPEEDIKVRSLFEKALSLRMDQHALAIADGYRTRPQVCVCNDVCCNCFDYSNFLHNLKLHNHKRLLKMLLAETQRSRKESIQETPLSKQPSVVKEKSMLGDECEEFTLKTDEDCDYKNFKDAKFDSTVVDKIKKIVSYDVSVSSAEKKSTVVLQKATSSHQTTKILEAPYETKLNSVHQRVREFDPNDYKNLVRKEVKELSEVLPQTKTRIDDLSRRPPWKI